MNANIEKRMDWARHFAGRLLRHAGGKGWEETDDGEMGAEMEREWRKIEEGIRGAGRERLEGLGQAELEREWQGWERRYWGRELSVGRKRRRWWWGGVAAACVVCGGIAGGVLWGSGDEGGVGGEVVQAVEQIEAGGVRAMLVLGDGKRVELEGAGEMLLQEEDGTAVEVSDAEGLVYDGTAGSGEGEQLFHTLVVPERGEYKLQLADGTRVWVNAGTEFRYPVHFAGAERRVWLKGEAYFEVAKDAAHPFVVETEGTAGVRVLGTEFNVSAYPEEGAVVATLVGGRVELFNAERAMLLNPDEQGRVDAATGEMDKREVDAAMVVAWKEGMYIFEDTPLEEIMQRLGRWYGIETEFADEAVRKIRFDGEFRKYDDLNVVLELLERVSNIKIHIKEKRVIIGTK